MKYIADGLSLFGFWLLVDWKVIPEWIFVHFVQHKHGDFYNRFDTAVLHYARMHHELYDPKKDADKKLLAFMSLFLSGIISLALDFYTK